MRNQIKIDSISVGILFAVLLTCFFGILYLGKDYFDGPEVIAEIPKESVKDPVNVVEIPKPEKLTEPEHTVGIPLIPAEIPVEDVQVVDTPVQKIETPKLSDAERLKEEAVVVTVPEPKKISKPKRIVKVISPVKRSKPVRKVEVPRPLVKKPKPTLASAQLYKPMNRRSVKKSKYKVKDPLSSKDRMAIVRKRKNTIIKKKGIPRRKPDMVSHPAKLDTYYSKCNNSGGLVWSKKGLVWKEKRNEFICIYE